MQEFFECCKRLRIRKRVRRGLHEKRASFPSVLLLFLIHESLRHTNGIDNDTRSIDAYFIFNDDDIFLSPGQISRLLSALHLDPSRLHGVQGQIYSETHDSLIHRDSYVFGVEKEADIINRIYACDFEHIRGFFCLIDMLSTNHKFIYWYKSFWDDMVLSFTGKSKPMTHDVGYVLNCPTSSQAGIAEWRREGFFENRNRLFHRLRTLKSF